MESIHSLKTKRSAVLVDWSKAFKWDSEVEAAKEKIFGINNPFRLNQREAINCILSKRDCFVIMV